MSYEHDCQQIAAAFTGFLRVCERLTGAPFEATDAELAQLLADLTDLDTPFEALFVMAAKGLQAKEAA